MPRVIAPSRRSWQTLTASATQIVKSNALAHPPNLSGERKMDLKRRTVMLQRDIQRLLRVYTKETDERVGMIDVYKDEEDNYVIKPILGEPEYED